MTTMTRRWAVAIGAVAVVAAVAWAAAPDPDSIRDNCTDAMQAYADEAQAAIEQIEMESDAQLNALDNTPAPASRYYRIMLTAVERIEKEQGKAIAKINKEADKCLARLQRLNANQNSLDFVEQVRTSTHAQTGDAGFLAIEGMHDVLSNLLFAFG